MEMVVGQQPGTRLMNQTKVVGWLQQGTRRRRAESWMDNNDACGSWLQLQDDECIALFLSGEQAAFAELVRRHQNRVFRFLLRMMGCREEALELTQDTMLRAFRALPGWEPDATFSTWLFRIASNAATDRLRRKKVVKYVPIEDHMDFPDPAAGPEDEFQSAQRYRILEAALQRLPSDYRQIILLRELEGMSYAEIGGVLGLCEGTVKSRIARARQALLETCKSRLA